MYSQMQIIVKAVIIQMGLFKGIFGANAYSNRELKRIEPIKNKVLDLDEEFLILIPGAVLIDVSGEQSADMKLCSLIAGAVEIDRDLLYRRAGN